ncbi:MAG: cytochrome c [Bryobacterales bacterium]
MNKATAAVIALLLLAAAGCRQDMHDGPYLERYEYSAFFEDHRASRPTVEARWREVSYARIRTSMRATSMASSRRRSRSRSLAKSSSAAATASTSTARLAMASLATAGVRLCNVASRARRPITARVFGRRPGHFYNVITNGYGRMFSFNDRVQPRDRWAIVSYIRALQFSQSAPIDQLPASVVTELRAEGIQ